MPRPRPSDRSGGVVVVKAQVKTGGRGKAGGVKVAKSVDEAVEAGARILGMDIKGHTVRRVMVAAGAKIAEEYYFSLLLDRANRSYLAMCSKEGGMDIEVLAVEKPEALAKAPVDPEVGIDQAKAAARSSTPPASTRPTETSWHRYSSSSVPSTSRRTRPWSRSTRWLRPRTVPSSRSTAR